MRVIIRKYYVYKVNSILNPLSNRASLLPNPVTDQVLTEMSYRVYSFFSLPTLLFPLTRSAVE